ncbi:hypothetical protein CKN96_05920 [Carnobacterium maltaromaticum]|uniref:hypothetical protein n=1 Tax=Carnobacterium maltaromaticum TaxID=2751 RepID=UPI0010743F8C|nr:hypothetical protein [Carnobacterium maltaromaticum]TFJ58767.1 hypothetical protein CKN96_05920 [Carnobacterium maltaromaticum]
MTKIDESKQYKFSEIIAMLEGKEFPLDTCVFNSDGEKYTVKKTTVNYFGLVRRQQMAIQAIISAKDINGLWTIKLPPEDKFYLKAPDCFTGFLFLKHNKNIQKYYTSDKYEDAFTQVKFTQKEIDAMPFDTKFFEKIKVEQADE